MRKQHSLLSAALRKYFRASALTAAGSALLLAGGPAAAEKPPDEVFAPTTQITLPSPQNITRFDISFVDPVIGQYFLADRTNKAVDVIDTATNTLLTQLKATPPFAGFTGNNDTSGPDGVITVGHKEVWAGDGDSTIKVISLLTGATTHVIKTGGQNRADELCLDPRDHLVMMANDAETPFPFVTLISTETYSVLKTIVMNGTAGTPKATNGIEQCQWSPRTGKFYLNIPEVNGPGDDSAPGAVLVISPDVVIPGTPLIENTFNIPIDKCAGPQGMAIGPEDQILLGCNASSSTVIIDARSGSIIATLDNEGGADEVWFNEGDSQYFLAESAPSFSSNQLLGVIDAWSHQQDQSVVTGIKSTAATPRGSNHSVAADPVLNQVYVPIASNSGSTICGSLGGSNTRGCIAVFTAKGDDKPRPPQ